MLLDTSALVSLVTAEAGSEVLFDILADASVVRVGTPCLVEAAMVLDGAKQPDALGHGVWMIDLHDPKGVRPRHMRDHRPRTRVREFAKHASTRRQSEPSALRNAALAL